MIGKRVEIPAWCDRWMMGDRYGVVVKLSRKDTIAHVQMDKSGKTVRYFVDHLTDVS